MKMRRLKSTAVMAWILGGFGLANAQPTVAPSAVSFSYQMGSGTLLQQQKVVITLPKGNSSQILQITNVVVALYQLQGTTTCNPISSTACGWLSVTPNAGSSPLTVIVTANPSTLTAGSYTGFFTVSTTTAPFNPVTVNVTLSISNPPSKLAITSPSFPFDSSGNQVPNLSFSYTTGSDATTLGTAQINVSSTGDIIPFTVVAANVSSKAGAASAVWLRVALVSGGTGLGATSASSSAFPGSYVGIVVSLDYTTVATLDPAGSPYSGTVTIAATNSVNGSVTVGVTLNIAAGAPLSTAVFPQAVNALPPGSTAAANYIFTLIGDNFFTTSSVSLQQGTPASPVGQNIPLPQPTFLSRQVLQVSVNPAYFTVPSAGSYPVPWFLKVGNPVASTNPALQPAYFTFNEVDPTQPTVSGVVNAASYQPASTWQGTGTDPLRVSGNQTAVSPREIISIFGQNLGPATASTATTITDATGRSYYDTTWGNVMVTFTYLDTSRANPILVSYNAPILMTYTNQINAIVPKELSAVFALASQQVSMTVTNNNSVSTVIPFMLTVLPENPGMFTFGGLGLGQGAVINYDSTGTITSVNSTKNSEPRGDTVAIYVTGMGDLSDPSVGTGDIISTATNPVADQTVRVDIGGQPSVVTYAGAAQLTVAGLVQINAVVPPNAKTGAVPIMVSIGAAGSARSSQAGVTIGVK